MRLNFDLPLFSREKLRRNPLLDERVMQWEIGGAHGKLLNQDDSSLEEKLATVDIAGSSPAAATSHSNDNASTSTTEAAKRIVTEESELRSSKSISPLQAPEWIFDDTTEEDEI
eukprot:1684621-Pleurochrysis_carterae.AAC.1